MKFLWLRRFPFHFFVLLPLFSPVCKNISPRRSNYWPSLLCTQAVALCWIILRAQWADKHHYKCMEANLTWILNAFQKYYCISLGNLLSRAHPGSTRSFQTFSIHCLSKITFLLLHKGNWKYQIGLPLVWCSRLPRNLPLFESILSISPIAKGKMFLLL
jgi:hypothetical protein